VSCDSVLTVTADISVCHMSLVSEYLFLLLVNLLQLADNVNELKIIINRHFKITKPEQSGTKRFSAMSEVTWR